MYSADINRNKYAIDDVMREILSYGAFFPRLLCIENLYIRNYLIIAKMG